MAERGETKRAELTREEMLARSRRVTLEQVILFLNGTDKALRTTPQQREERRAALARGLLPHFNVVEQKAILAATKIQLEEVPCSECRGTAGVREEERNV